jgi:hypothetical protein
MKKLLKYSIEPDQTDQTVQMPIDVEILDFQAQDNKIVLWIVGTVEEKEADTKTKPLNFKVLKTGDECTLLEGKDDHVWIYARTLQLDKGLKELHIFIQCK